MWSALRCRALRFVIDCDDGAALLALRDAARPFGVSVRCRRVTCWRDGRAEQRADQHDRQHGAQIEGRQSEYRPNFQSGREPNQRQARIDRAQGRDGS